MFLDHASKQPVVTTILANGIKNDKLSHCYVFEGLADKSKGEIARLLAKRFFCLNPKGVDPCMTCADCKRINSLNHPDFHLIQPQGETKKSIKIDQIRALQKEFGYKSVESEKKFFIIEQAELLTTQASNALLKFIEEPEGEIICVLVTKRASMLLSTIQSRAQIISFLPEPYTLENVDTETNEILSFLTNDQEIAKELVSEDWFTEAITLTKKVISDIESRRFFLSVEWLEMFKDRSELGLDLLLFFFRKKGDFKAASHLLEAKDALKSNGNLQMQFEKTVALLTK